MTDPTLPLMPPDRPDDGDPLHAAYRDAHALAADAGPSPAVRAAVLAAAQRIAAESRAAAAATAAPGRGRGAAANHSSWRWQALGSFAMVVMASGLGWHLWTETPDADAPVRMADATPPVLAQPDVAQAPQRQVAPVTATRPEPAPAPAAAPVDHAAPVAAAAQEARAEKRLAATADLPRPRADMTAGAVAAKALARSSIAPATAPPSAPSLALAAEQGDTATLARLLQAPDPAVDARDARGRTALLRAVLAGQVASARLLLAAGADPQRADDDGLTPREAARRGGSDELARLLEK